MSRPAECLAGGWPRENQSWLCQPGSHKEINLIIIKNFINYQSLSKIVPGAEGAQKEDKSYKSINLIIIMNNNNK